MTNKAEKGLSTKQLALVGMLAGLYLVLSYLSVGTNHFKVSFESLPIVVGGLLLGPVPGLLVGLLGEFVHQLLLYGLDPTTPLWLIPYAAEGLAVGLAAKKNFGKLSRKEIIIAILVGEFVLTFLNTPVIWLSATIQGWGSWAIVAAGIPLRLALMAARMVVYSVAMPPLYTPLRKLVK